MLSKTWPLGSVKCVLGGTPAKCSSMCCQLPTFQVELPPWLVVATCPTPDSSAIALGHKTSICQIQSNVIKVASSLSAQLKFGIVKPSHCLRRCRLLHVCFCFKKSLFLECKLQLLWLSQATNISWQLQLSLHCSVWLDSILLSLLGKGEGQKHLRHNTGSSGSNYLVHNNHHVQNDIKVHLRHVFLSTTHAYEGQYSSSGWISIVPPQ